MTYWHSGWQSSYSPFGLATINNDVDGNSNTVELNIRFPGQYWDSETGLHYNWLRYYDPSVCLLIIILL
ncbi:MAG: hypothetical protein HRT37_25260 [Alteromonadaceae bacterium]|nr:hypothetical protein [Alteromonadaceae bacterium]